MFLWLSPSLFPSLDVSLLPRLVLPLVPRVVDWMLRSFICLVPSMLRSFICLLASMLVSFLASFPRCGSLCSCVCMYVCVCLSLYPSMFLPLFLSLPRCSSRSLDVAFLHLSPSLDEIVESCVYFLGVCSYGCHPLSFLPSMCLSFLASFLLSFLVLFATLNSYGGFFTFN